MSTVNYVYRSPSRKSKWRGTWITKSSTGVDAESLEPKTIRVYECSVCTSKYYGESLFPTNYCPNCGADMRELEKGSGAQCYSIIEAEAEK